MGEVILGMPGAWADDNLEAADHYTTKMGGIPDWPCLKSVIRADLLRCDSCGEDLCLVAQIYAPVSSKMLTTEERVLYIFSCVAPVCGTMIWRVLRLQRSFHGKESNTLGHNELQDDLWTFENDDVDLDELGRALTEATTLACQPKKRNTPLDKCPRKRAADDKTKVLPCFYIYTQAQEENFLKSSLLIKETRSEGDEGETWEGESYEYDRALNADRTYLKFKKRLDLHPEQCFRYSYGGKPLLAKADAGDPGRCTMCGESRHFEMQLMPPLLYFLKEATNKYSLENWNWISLIVYTCSKGCAPESDEWVVVEEAVFVQTE